MLKGMTVMVEMLAERDQAPFLYTRTYHDGRDGKPVFSSHPPSQS